MRFYAEVKDYKYLNELRRNPFTYFAHDLFYFICREYGLEWTPFEINKPVGVAETVSPRPRTYLPHPESFFDSDMQHGMRCLFRTREDVFRKTYGRLVPEGAKNKLELYLDHVFDVLDRIVKLKFTPGEMYHAVACLGRVSALFYEDGCRDAGFLAPALIADCLWLATYGIEYKTVFRLMNERALRSIDDYYLHSGIFKVLEKDHNCDELENDHCDESQLDRIDE